MCVTNISTNRNLSLRNYSKEELDQFDVTNLIYLISIIDTLLDSSNNDIAPFKNILNDMYAKDLSRKVKLAKRKLDSSGATQDTTTQNGGVGFHQIQSNI